MWMQQTMMWGLQDEGFGLPAGIQMHVVGLLADAMQSYEHCKYDYLPA